MKVSAVLASATRASFRVSAPEASSATARPLDRQPIVAEAFSVPPDAAKHVRDAHEWPYRHDGSRTYLLLQIA
jgi:hypothetical protein